ncbi:MAG: phage holin family protein [bacterium]|nr:phage holin family protein [bacterium]
MHSLTVTVSFFIAQWIVPGFEIDSLYFALISAILLGLLNLTLKPLLILLTLPFTILTLGLFVWVVNGLVLWFLASFVSGFSVSGFWAAFFGALIISLFGTFVDALSKER